MQTKLETFRALLEQQQIQGLTDQGYNPANHAHLCKIKLGRKYANVDVSCVDFGDGHSLGSGRYMVELSTGAIYGIKGYGVIHRGHYYGTLDTIEDYDWRGYTAVKRQSKAA